jgi:hypothetical protein
MKHGDYFASAAPEPWRILGHTLLPLSAGHLILLHRVESAFVSGEQPLFDDLALSVFICSRPYDETLAAWDSPAYPKYLKRWQKQVGRFDFHEKARLFAEYMEAGQRGPTYEFSADSEGQIHCPSVQVIKCFLLSRMGGLTEREFLNRPWSVSLWDYATLLMIDGKVKMVDPAEFEDMEAFGNEALARFQRGELKI